MIELLILDVDGVLTNGDLPYDASGGDACKTFHVQDGGAIRLWQSLGGQVALLSGRQSAAVVARARDLDIKLVTQGVTDKLPAYEAICKAAGVSNAQTSFVGDDWVDLPPMQRCGYPIAVANACPAVKRVSRYVTRRCGGAGAVTEAIERLLRHNGTWQTATARWMDGSLSESRTQAVLSKDR